MSFAEKTAKANEALKEINKARKKIEDELFPKVWILMRHNVHTFQLEIVGSYSSKENANKILRELEKEYGHPYYVIKESVIDREWLNI